MKRDQVLYVPINEIFPKYDSLQGSHSHGKSGKVIEKFVVVENHGKVMENNRNSKSHGKIKILP